MTELLKAGWKAPEVFTAPGRDGKTRYLGNHHPPDELRSLEEVSRHRKYLRRSAGIVRSQSHSCVYSLDDVASGDWLHRRANRWHGNVEPLEGVSRHGLEESGDAGFPDRILWHKAVAAKYPSYDITRVGIYGGFGWRPELDAARCCFIRNSTRWPFPTRGCHDNRMDKMWWNEQWMGWPIGPQYSASSNVDNAYRLQGDLLLIVGELDTNVDPSSTMQVVHQLMKHNKNFDLLVVPGANHPAARGDQYAAYGDHKRFDFFVQHLLGVTPAPWNHHGVDSRGRAARACVRHALIGSGYAAGSV